MAATTCRGRNAGSVRDLALRGHAAADAGRDGGALLPAIPRAVPDIGSLAAAEEDAVLDSGGPRLLLAWRATSIARRRRSSRSTPASSRASSPTSRRCRGSGDRPPRRIAGFAFGARAAILDGNVKRVLARQVRRGRYRASGPWSAALAACRVAAAFHGHRAIHFKDSWTSRHGVHDARPSASAARCERRASRSRRTASASCRAAPAAHGAASTHRHAGPAQRRRRPAAEATAVGVWSGLWCFPELGAEDDPVRVARRLYGCEVAAVERLGTLRHGFTHFTLDIEPVIAR